MKIDIQGAKTWREAVPIRKGEMNSRIYGNWPCERIDLSHRTFIKLRDGKYSRGKRIVGHLEIESKQEERPKCRVYAVKEEPILVYEIESKVNPLQLCLSYRAENKADYKNYNIGGLFFTSEQENCILCGKIAVQTNGFTKADTQGITVKNATKVNLYIMMDMTVVIKASQKDQAMLDLQMQMNRKLVRFESKFKKQD